MRREDIKPITSLGEFYDKVYSDKVLAKTFPNMEFNVRGDK